VRLKGGPSAAFLFVLALKFHRNPSRHRTVGSHISSAQERRQVFSQVPHRRRACEQRLARPESRRGFSRGRKPIGLRNCGTDRRSKTTSHFSVEIPESVLRMIYPRNNSDVSTLKDMTHRCGARGERLAHRLQLPDR